MIPYEKEWANSFQPFLSYTIDNLNWHIHFHSAFEICYILDGEINITIDENCYALKKNDAVIIFPRQLHSYETEKHSIMHHISFSQELVDEFTNTYKNMIPQNNYIADLEKYKDYFYPKNTCSQKGLLYSILGDLIQNADFKAAPMNEETVLIHKILSFVEENYNGECSLHSATDKLSYGYTYLSRTFKKLMKMSYTEYLNRYRINRAVYLLITEKNMSVQKIAELCGYDSMCCFHHNFKTITGYTPRDIRAEAKRT